MKKPPGIIGSVTNMAENLNNAGALKVLGLQPSFGLFDLAVTAANAIGGSRRACNSDVLSGAANYGTNTSGSSMTASDDNHCFYTHALNIEAGSPYQPAAGCGCPCGGAK